MSFELFSVFFVIVNLEIPECSRILNIDITISGQIVFNEAPRHSKSSPVFKWSAPTTMTFECSLDDESYRPCGKGTTGQWVGNNVPDGQHSFKIKATDSVGNVVETEVRGWIVDTVVPTITFVDAPVKTNGSPMITWQSSEQADFNCSLDGGPYVTCGKGILGQWSENNIRDGSHRLSVKGEDAAGNVGSNSLTWIVGKVIYRIPCTLFRLFYRCN